MKKILVLCVLCLTGVFLFTGASMALASGYLSDGAIQAMTSPNDPHGNYATTTNKCKACHAVHLATGSYRLLRANSAGTECQYCHGTGGIIGGGPGEIKWVDGTTTNGHTMNNTTATIRPDDDVDTGAFITGSDGLRCADCHSPHDNNTVQLQDVSRPSTQLLKNNPDGQGSPLTGSDYLSKWCADCHGANHGLHTLAKTVGGQNRYGHDSSDAGAGVMDDIDPDDGDNKGPTCNECHRNTGFPHDSNGTAQAMLKDASFDPGPPAKNLDDVCIDCHTPASLP